VVILNGAARNAIHLGAIDLVGIAFLQELAAPITGHGDEHQHHILLRRRQGMFQDIPSGSSRRSPKAQILDQGLHDVAMAG